MGGTSVLPCNVDVAKNTIPINGFVANLAVCRLLSNRHASHLMSRVLALDKPWSTFLSPAGYLEIISTPFINLNNYYWILSLTITSHDNVVSGCSAHTSQTLMVSVSKYTLIVSTFWFFQLWKVILYFSILGIIPYRYLNLALWVSSWFSWRSTCPIENNYEDWDELSFRHLRLFWLKCHRVVPRSWYNVIF